ncbi:MAG: NAD(+)--dinitrogen-reductase ADP-D-ribosyltransferase [Sulfurisoma sp.]|nr:NAD(+)--dinitrogen-reductase ADP-D-ribosyltransferase [Sulfurisoma sp.]
MPTRSDNAANPCSSSDNSAPGPTLPTWARLPINRCNLPAVILGSLTFQRHPTALVLDGVAELHAELFALLDGIYAAAERAQLFRDYVAAHFCLDHLEDAGIDEHSKKRAKANWLRALRGWSFDADSREGAVLKGWVESRFGLLPRFHGEPLRDFTGPAWLRYEEMRAGGISGTNALEAQLDLLYAYCQYEFARAATGDRLTLYRGINRLGEHEVLSGEGRRQVVLFNNLASFTANRERAGEFGDYILATEIPLAKIFFHCALLPGILKGEDEHLVIGGAYEVTLSTL